MYKKFFKRFFDIFLSLLAIIILLPVIIVISLLIKLKLGSPIFFKQPRAGKNEKIFYLIKFRSMSNAKDENGKLLPDNKRLTKFGKFLRKSSIDELPELFNILRGDMSIVGPRPLSIYYLKYYNSKEKRRHETPPGLTGLAQINGRNNLDWDQKLKLDIDYIENISFKNDFNIIVNTIIKVFKGSDVTVLDNNVLKNFTSFKIVNEEKETHKMKNNSSREIGSFYHLEENSSLNYNNNSYPDWLPLMSDSTFTYSGRNAIGVVLKDIINNKKIKKAYLPSYCCMAMLEPFIELNIPYDFYEVSFSNKDFYYKLPKSISENDIILIMSYFGLDCELVHQLIHKLKVNNTIVIEDITHSLFNETPFSPESDYLVASLRKWLPTPTGGWCGKISGTFSFKPSHDSNSAVLSKIKGMKEKSDYLKGENNDKKSFLLKNAQFEGELSKAIFDLKIDDLSKEIIENSNVKDLISKRKQNAQFLLKNLVKYYPEIIVPNFELDKTTPLFVPIFLNQNKRDSLRTYLIEKGIYSPVHWPEVMGAKPGIRESQLSLICDQRYNIKDMTYIIECISEWFNLK